MLGSSLVAQLRRLVYEPFKAAAKRVRLLKTFLLKGPFLIVIDGLDECEDRKDVEAFIDDMLNFFNKNPLVPLRFFITSRVEQHIQGRLEKDQVRLENLVNHCSRDDIDTFMRTCFESEKRRNPVVKAYIRDHGDWPTKKDKAQLVDHIGGSFIFASALFKYIMDPTDDHSTPMDRLPHTLNMNPGLDTLYAKTLSRSQHLPYFSDVISALALLFEPLPIIGIAELLGIKSFEVVRVLVNLQAIIHIPGTDDLPVTMCHTSLRDFLTTESRSERFFALPSYHLYLLYRCFTVYRWPPDTVAASYAISYFTEHIEQLTRLPTTAQGPSPRFPQTLDAFYAHILAKSENDFHSSDIISTIALLTDPLSVAGTSELLGIEPSEVVRVLVNLQPVINIPENSDLPITMCHPSVHQFLTTERRSGRFFVSPSYHLKLSNCFFGINFEAGLSNTPRLLPRGLTPCRSRSEWHWTKGLETPSEASIGVELDRLSHLPRWTSPYQHLSSFIRLFLWIFQASYHEPQQILLALTKCIESLALALECDHPRDILLLYPFYEDMIFGPARTTFLGPLEIHQEHVMALQHSVQRVESARAKGLSHFFADSYNPNVDTIWMNRSTGNWTVMDAYQLFKWIATHVEAGTDPAGSGVVRILGLHITRTPESVKICIQPDTQPFAI